jgi:signal transduction histidine kinase
MIAETGTRAEKRRRGASLAGRPLRRLLHTSLDAVGKLVDTRMASIRLVRDDYLVPVYNIGLPSEYVRAVARTPIGVGCCGVAVEESRPVVIENIPCSRTMSAFQCVCEKYALRSVWCLPLRTSDNRVLGGLALYHDHAFRPTVKAAQDVEVFGEAIASALEYSLHVRNEGRAQAGDPSKWVAARFLDVQEAERRRIAEDLHDELIQELVGIQLMLECASGDDDDDPMRTASTGLGKLVAHLRELIFELRPLTLESDGLPRTVAVMLARLEERTGIVTRFNCQVAGRLPLPCEQLAYRVIREGLQNVKRHAFASTTSVDLALRNGRLEIALSDDGVGFDPELALHLSHFGLASIRHQVESLGGSLNTISSPGAGTTLQVRIPMSQGV